MKFGKKLKTSSEKNLTVTQYIIKKYPKAKIKSYNEKTNTIFDSNKVPKEGSQFIC